MIYQCFFFLLLVEKVTEYRSIDKAQQNTNAIHIIDGYFLEGDNLLFETYNDKEKVTSLLNR